MWVGDLLQSHLGYNFAMYSTIHNIHILLYSFIIYLLLYIYKKNTPSHPNARTPHYHNIFFECIFSKLGVSGAYKNTPNQLNPIDQQNSFPEPTTIIYKQNPPTNNLYSRFLQTRHQISFAPSVSHP